MRAGQVEGKWHSWAHCADEKGANAFRIWPSSVSVAPLSHRGSIASPVKLLLLMMSQWGLFVIWYDTPPLSHIPFTLQTSIFPWPSKTTPPLSHTGQPRLRTLHNQYLKWKKKGKVGVWRPPKHHQLTHLPPRLKCLCLHWKQPIENRWQNWLVADKDNRQGHLGQ